MDDSDHDSDRDSGQDSDRDSDRDSDYGSDGSDSEPEAAVAAAVDATAAAGGSAPAPRGSEGPFGHLMSGLESGDPDTLLAALTGLCEVLSFSMEDSLRGVPTDTLVPRLVDLAGFEASPDIMLLAVRSITYLCEAMPRAAEAVVRHGAIPVICARLLVIEYVDVAEQGLQALEKISKKQPVPCLQEGVISAVLTYIDFFSTSVQICALSTVSNICKKLPLDSASLVLDSVPTLCNLLQYDDRKLVETVATCLVRITDSFSKTPVLLDELCNHGVIGRVLVLIDARNSLSQTSYTGLIGMLTKLAARSLVAVRTLFELNVSSSLRTILASPGLSCGSLEAAQTNQIIETLKLLIQLVPPLALDNEDLQLVLAKEKILVEHPEFLLQFALDIFPVALQVVNSGANLIVCYGCVSVINNVVYVCTPDMLLELTKYSNISSFLAGLLARKDQHVLLLTLKIIESLMQKLPGVFSSSFIKEGVLHAIHMFIAHENLSLKTEVSDNQSPKNVPRCLCKMFDSTPSSSSEVKACRLGKDTVLMLAKNIKSTHFANESMDVDMCLTESLEKLKLYCGVLNDDGCAQKEKYLSHVLDQVLSEVNGGEVMSTFEFIESGLVKSLANYLCNGKYLRGSPCDDLSNNFLAVLKRFQTFACNSLSKSGQNWEEMVLTLLVRKLQSALSTSDNFPVILSDFTRPRNTYADIPARHSTTQPCLRISFVRDEEDTNLCDHDGVLSVEISSSLDSIEEYLWPEVSKIEDEEEESVDMDISEKDSEETDADTTVAEPLEGDVIEEGESLQVDAKRNSSFTETVSDVLLTEEQAEGGSASPVNEDAKPKLTFSIGGKLLDRSVSLYQAILQYQLSSEPDMVVGPRLWTEVHKVTYKTADETSDSQSTCDDSNSYVVPNITGFAWQKLSFFSSMLHAELPCKLDKSDPSYDILFMLKVLEGLNRFSFHLMSYEKINAYAEGRIRNSEDLKVVVSSVPQSEFINSKLTEKLEQQLRDRLASSAASMPSWCSQLINVCPFLFSFEVRRKYFSTTVFGTKSLQNQNASSSNSSNDRRTPRKKFRVSRKNVLKSAAQMMVSHACGKDVLEVEYYEEVGTGLGPTMEFFTMVGREFQKNGLGMWRGDHEGKVGDNEFVVAPSGLFPRPWSGVTNVSDGGPFSEVIKSFVLLGQFVAKAIKDGRILDIPVSPAFYKVILEQELGIYDIQLFDLELGRTLLEFQAVVNKRRYLESNSSSLDESELCFRNTRIEDLCLDFTLPGYSDYVLTSGSDVKMVNITNLEDYISEVVDATIRSGISRQVEAFKSGFNQVFPLEALQIFTEDELERLLCGESDAWNVSELMDHIKFDHGYTASSPPAISLLEIMQEFESEERRAFLQFVTGAPRLPPGGLAALNPKLTVVRKICGNETDMDLPSVMTCANYLKLSPYSSKERMRQRLLYAIQEGQGSFHLS